MGAWIFVRAGLRGDDDLVFLVAHNVLDVRAWHVEFLEFLAFQVELGDFVFVDALVLAFNPVVFRRQVRKAGLIDD